MSCANRRTPEQSKARRTVFVVGGALLAASVRLAPVATVAALPGCGNSCDPETCAQVAGSLSSNGKTFTQCITCDADGNCETVLQDDTGATFFDCTDGEGKDCTSAVVNAQFGYCDVQ